jgi:hypothetical protein
MNIAMAAMLAIIKSVGIKREKSYLAPLNDRGLDVSDPLIEPALQIWTVA